MFIASQNLLIVDFPQEDLARHRAESNRRDRALQAHA
jgi:hypothetical protein